MVLSTLFIDEYPIYLFLTKTHLIKDSYIQIKTLNIKSNWKLLLRIIKSALITNSSRVTSPHHILKTSTNKKKDTEQESEKKMEDFPIF